MKWTGQIHIRPTMHKEACFACPTGLAKQLPKLEHCVSAVWGGLSHRKGVKRSELSGGKIFTSGFLNNSNKLCPLLPDPPQPQKMDPMTSIWASKGTEWRKLHLNSLPPGQDTECTVNTLNGCKTLLCRHFRAN